MGNEWWREQALYELALSCCAAGEFTSAETYGRQGLEAVRDAEDTWGERLLLFPLALIYAWRGEVDRSRAAAERHRSESEPKGERLGVARALQILGLIALSEGDPAAAAGDLTGAADLSDELGYGHPGAIPVLPDAIEALATAGDAEQAAELLRRLEWQADAVDSAWARAAAGRARGAVLLAGGDPAQAAEVLEHAAAEFDRLGFRPDAARATFLRGRALLRGGRRTLAADVLSDARSRFESMGARLWEARVIEELERASPGRASGELTPAEARVASLVARGLKNREIAAELFMAVATVEAHLTRIYRKLDIRSRSELARLVAEGSVAPVEGSGSTGNGAGTEPPGVARRAVGETR